MATPGTPDRLRQGFIALLAAWISAGAHAQTSVSWTLGTGAGDYRSQSLQATLAPASWPLSVEADAMQARESGATVNDQYGLAFEWAVHRAASLRYRWSNQRDTTFLIDGHELGSTIRLDRLWGGDLATRLDIGTAMFDYAGRNATAAQSRLLPDQRRYSLGLRQDLNAQLGLYGTYDSYHYSNDPAGLARLLATRKRPRVEAAFALTAFASQARSVGLTWSPMDPLNLDFSVGRTDTVLKQRQDIARVAANITVARNASVTLAYSNNRSSAILSAAGAVIQPSDRSSSFELSLGWTFD